MRSRPDNTVTPGRKLIAPNPKLKVMDQIRKTFKVELSILNRRNARPRLSPRFEVES
jgi:hypothetical protein